MFTRNTQVESKCGEINWLIVDVNLSAQKAAYYDRSLEGQTRKKRKEKTKRPSYKRVTSKPKWKRFEDIEALLENKQIEIARASFPDGLYIPENKSALDKERIRKEREEKCDLKFEIISYITEDKDHRYEYLYSNRSQRVIKELSKQFGIQAGVISRWLSEFFQRGGTRRALYPNYRNCGSNYNPLTEIVEGTKRRGPLSEAYEYRNVLVSDRDNIKELLKKTGKKLFKRHGYAGVYRMYDFMYQAEVTEGLDGEEIRKPKPFTDCISYQTFYNHARKLVEDPLFQWGKKEDKVFLAPYLNRMQRARDNLPGPTFRYEIDATVEDAYISFPYQTNQRLSSGRPVVYRVIDVWSTMTVGLHVALEGPNWKGASQALLNAFTDKVEFCKRFGIDIEPEWWPAYFTCNHLTIDNGIEYPKQKMLDLLQESIGIECINYTPIYKGDAKGTVEGSFNQSKNNLVKFMPGYVERIPERGARHASNAYNLIDYKPFVALLIWDILKTINKHNPKVLVQESAKRDVDATALEAWNFGLKHYMNDGKYKKFPIEDLLYTLLPSGSASTCREGIRYKDLYYHCDFAQSQGWLTDDKHRAVKKLDIRYCDESTNSIWYRHEGNYYAAQLTSLSEVYANVTWYDALHKLKLLELRAVDLDIREREGMFKTMQELENAREESRMKQAQIEPMKRKSPSEHLALTNQVAKHLHDQTTAELYSHIMGQQIELPTLQPTVQTHDKTTNNNLQAMFGETS